LSSTTALVKDMSMFEAVWKFKKLNIKIYEFKTNNWEPKNFKTKICQKIEFQNLCTYNTYLGL